MLENKSSAAISSPEVDVLMTAFNAAPYIHESIQSIQRQTIKDIRIIVIDDGSTDKTFEILKNIAKEDERILLIRQENTGIVGAVNKGLTYCTAPFIARQDADDLSDPDRFERQLQWFKSHPECVAVSGNARFITETGQQTGGTTHMMSVLHGDCFEFPAIEPYLLQPMLMLRRSALDAVGGYRYIFNSEDSDLYWRLYKNNRLDNLPDILGSYRVHSGSITGTSTPSGWRTAFGSQMGAVSAQRRATGQSDLVFDRAMFDAVKAKSRPDDLLALALPQITDAERSWLAVAMAAKFLEQCTYRPFLPAQDDVAFIRQAFDQNWKTVPPASQAKLRNLKVRVASRMILKGHAANAVSLMSGDDIARLPVRLAYDLLTNSPVKSVIGSLKKKLKKSEA